MMMKQYIWPAVILVSAAAIELVSVSSPGALLSLLLALWFLLVCPGMAFVRLLHLREALAEWMLAIALSIVLDMLFAEISVLNRILWPQGVLLWLVVISVIGAVLQIGDSLRIRETHREVIHELND